MSLPKGQSALPPPPPPQPAPPSLCLPGVAVVAVGGYSQPNPIPLRACCTNGAVRCMPHMAPSCAAHPAPACAGLCAFRGRLALVLLWPRPCQSSTAWQVPQYNMRLHALLDCCCVWGPRDELTPPHLQNAQEGLLARLLQCRARCCDSSSSSAACRCTAWHAACTARPPTLLHSAALRCAVWPQGELFRGAVLLAPMLSLEKVSRKGINPYLRPVSSLLSRLWPTVEIVATDRNALYPEIQAMWDEGEEGN